ncbi:BTB/POZ domain-containing protein 6-like [Dreissena polymorpha]|uniref:BTB domain-containing protein n=1 Tax=Dreissena polymorpha TaxID=45954 RepID=A0A9D4LSM7_DREPO|nr:BTB/POZ domain-containing protein 6-like [Dreissena polymorpha]XP_052263145.1 BTB/POZ domain-containing protein 6-like [Dreissena polymorpha]KAH3863485.1 hypothetical protein DPMN_026474 [Dreissena polymorpha]
MSDNMSGSPPAYRWQVGKTIDQCLQGIFKNGIWTDVTFKCSDGRQVEAHRLVLAMRSPVFQAMFFGLCSEKKEEFEIEDADSTVFSEFLRFFYLDDAEVTQSNFHPLLILADKYEVPLLFQHMTKFIKSVVDVDNALELLELVIAFNAKQCMKTLLEFIDVNAEVLLNSEAFLRLNQRTVLTIIQGRTFNAPVTSLFEVTIKWAKKQCTEQGLKETGCNIRKVLGSLIYYLGLPTMTLDEFIKLTYKHEYLTFQEYEEIVAYIANNSSPLHDFMVEPRLPLYEILTVPIPHKFMYADYVLKSTITSELSFSLKADVKIVGFETHFDDFDFFGDGDDILEVDKISCLFFQGTVSVGETVVSQFESGFLNNGIVKVKLNDPVLLKQSSLPQHVTLSMVSRTGPVYVRYFSNEAIFSSSLAIKKVCYCEVHDGKNDFSFDKIIFENVSGRS